ncbi:lipocalin family protein [Polaribacter sp.]|uniref:lipocalin family protein n=1 Tax=Polaribacter sp. TaxID=1920175 RepID=UPI004048B9FE
MKKIIYLFIAMISLSSCSSNDDLDQDPIIGKWQLISQKEDNVEYSDDCSRRSTITFLENKTVTVSSYYDFGNACENISDSFSWMNLGNTGYELTYDPNDKETITIVFSENNTVFTVNESETYNNVTYTSSMSYRKI